MILSLSSKIFLLSIIINVILIGIIYFYFYHQNNIQVTASANDEMPKNISIPPVFDILGKTPSEFYLTKTPSEFYLSKTPSEFYLSKTPSEFYLTKTPSEFYLTKTPSEFYLSKNEDAIIEIIDRSERVYRNNIREKRSQTVIQSDYSQNKNWSHHQKNKSNLSVNKSSDIMSSLINSSANNSTTNNLSSDNLTVDNFSVDRLFNSGSKINQQNKLINDGFDHLRNQISNPIDVLYILTQQIVKQIFIVLDNKSPLDFYLGSDRNIKLIK